MNLLNTSESIGEYLETLYLPDGLFDPFEKRLLPNNYGHAMYALLCTLLYKKTKKNKWKILAEKAIENELLNTENRFKSLDMFRWEFKNFALLRIYSLFDDLNVSLSNRLKKRILTMQNLWSFKTNWICMRGLNYILRYNLFHNKKDKLQAEKELFRVLKRQTSEGFFFDDTDTNTFQYHHYILALLIQYYKIQPSKILKIAIEKGLEVSKIITAPDGNNMYFGRGQEQVFGYASAIFSFMEAHNLIDDKKEYASYAKITFDHIAPYLRKNLILANDDELVMAGWYRYNYLTDYLAFAAVYLLLSDFTSKNISKPKIVEYEVFLSSINLFIKRTTEYYVCISSGGGPVSEMPGLVYFYPKVIPCAGGPHINMIRGELDYSHNYFGIGPGPNIVFRKRGIFHRDSDGLRLTYVLKYFKIIFFWKFGKDVDCYHRVIPFRKISLNLLHYAAWKELDTDVSCRSKGKIITPQGVANIYESDPVIISKSLEAHIKLYCGKKLPTEIKAMPFIKPKKRILLFEKIAQVFRQVLHKLINSPVDLLYSFFYLYVRNHYKRKKKFFIFWDYPNPKKYIRAVPSLNK